MAARAGRDAASRPGPLRVALVTMPTSEAIDIVGTLDILFLANNALRSAGGRGLGYAVEIVAAAPGAISRWVGLDLVARRPYHALRGPIDTLIIGSVDDPTPLTRNARLVAWVRRTAPRARRIVALCTGAFLLAEARVLEGRRATTH
jgi:transcriptional regulator GlxA family with amidase domain